MQSMVSSIINSIKSLFSHSNKLSHNQFLALSAQLIDAINQEIAEAQSQGYSYLWIKEDEAHLKNDLKRMSGGILDMELIDFAVASLIARDYEAVFEEGCLNISWSENHG